MTASSSPFRAGFGKVPPTLAGRTPILAAFRSAIEVGAWSRERATLLRGFRGVGKTVLLESLRRIAEDDGWVTIDETASDGFSERMIGKLRAAIRERDPEPTTRVSSVGIAQIGEVGFEHSAPEQIEPTMESLVEALAGLVEPRGGILFTLDEVNTGTVVEFKAFVGAIQRCISRDREIAVVIAGLHGEVASVLRDNSVTFLRRASQENLDLLDWDATVEAIRQPVLDHGRTIDGRAVDYAARATQGYPFLTQLIGDLAWKQRQSSNAISFEDVRVAARKSKRHMGANIHEPSLSTLSALDRTVLAAMAQDDGGSRTADLRERLGSVSKQHFNNLRNRLLDAGIVYAPARGELDFALPYLRDYLREHTVTDAMGATSREIAAARSRFPPPPPDL